MNREGGKINKNQLHFWIAHSRNWVTVIIVKLKRGEKKKRQVGGLLESDRKHGHAAVWT